MGESEMNGSAEASDTLGAPHEGQGAGADTDGSSGAQAHAISVSAAAQDAHSSLKVATTKPHETEQSVAIPTSGFTSAFSYDPYMEIKDFLDALTSGVSFQANEPSKATKNVGRQEDEMNGQQSESQPILAESPAALQPPDSTTSQSLMPEEPESKNLTLVAATDAIEATNAPDSGPLRKSEDVLQRGNSNIVEPVVVTSLEEVSVLVGPPEVLHDVMSQLGETLGIEIPQQTKHPDAIPVETTSQDHQPLGSAASITASFAPQTKSAWAQLFGSRYEDEIESRSSHLSSREENQSPDGEDLVSERRLSLKAKLECERRIDQQIQASQQRFKTRSLRSSESLDPSVLAKPQLSPKRHSSAIAPISVKPFEMAGLSITSVRFCVEKALQATYKCFQQLHALALNEPRIPKFEAEHGVFVSQWELEQILQELFGAPQQGATISSLAGFALSNSQYAGVSLELLLQITWFVPFDQLTRLRSLVLQITRKHLNEHKLAVLNRHLQKQLLLIPYSTRLQQVLLQFSGHRLHSKDSDERSDGEYEDANSIASTAPPLVHCISGLARELFECIAVPVPAELLTSDKDFLLLSPFELVQKWRLSSLLCIQRVILFRFLVEAITSERSPNASKSVTMQKRERVKSSLLRTSQSIRSVQSRTRTTASAKQTNAKKKPKLKAKRPTANYDDSESERVEDTSETLHISRASVVAIHGSAASVAFSNNDEHHEAPNSLAAETQEQPNQQLHRLQLKLHASLIKLGDVIPWLHHSNDLGSPAIRATFLAASAFHQSLDIMIKSHLALDCDIMDKLQHFVDAIDALIVASDGASVREPRDVIAHQQLSSHPAVAAATVITRSDLSVNPPEKFPPPFPDLTRAEERARFPPPYESMGASYWAFTPYLPTPQPVTSVAKPATPSAIYPALYPVYPSPGVGAYDIQRSEKITFQQKAGHSFRKAGIAGDGLTPNKDLSGSFSAATPGKPRVHKGNAFSHPLPTGGSYALDSFEHDPVCHSIGIEIESVAAMMEPQEDDDEDADERLEVDILNALRRQHNMVVNDFMNDIVLQNHRPLPQLSPPQYTDDFSRLPFRPKATHSRGAKASTAAPEPKWSASSRSRFVNRMRGRDANVSPPIAISPRHEQQPPIRQSSDRPKSVPTAARTPAKSKPKKPMKTPLANNPEQPNDEHLVWAARISDFYRAKQSLDANE